jgi:Mg2+ and Co2+ transporter CorA
VGIDSTAHFVLPPSAERAGGLMLDAYLFDEHNVKKFEAWADALEYLDESQVLWLDLLEPSAEEARELGEALGLDGLEPGRFHEEAVQPAFDQGQEYLRVTALAARDADADASETVAVDCFVGENWVLTAHSTELAVIEDFRDRAEGEGKSASSMRHPSSLCSWSGW